MCTGCGLLLCRAYGGKVAASERSRPGGITWVTCMAASDSGAIWGAGSQGWGQQGLCNHAC